MRSSEGFVPPMEAKRVEALPNDAGWQFEPKWDGFRAIAVKRGGEVALFGKSGKPLGRYFPDMVAELLALPADDFVLDGELVIPVDGRLDFDALQMRLHPAASRVNKLAAEHPAEYVLFDLLRSGNEDIGSFPLRARREALEHFLPKRHERLRVSPATTVRTEAERWLRGTKASGDIDGVMAKRLDEAYAAGERTMLKVKRVRSADCVVGGFRYATGKREIGSLLLGLYDGDGRLDHVGFTSSFSAAERPDLTRKVEALRGEPGFTGRSPGGPSRWSTERTGQYEKLRHELVVEVAFDHVSGGRFRHGTQLLRFRPDKLPDQCGLEQLEG